MTEHNLYTARINLVQDYISQHLADPLPLAKLADVAGFSPFHFHRLFKQSVGETLNAFVTRTRLERAVALLRSTPTGALTDVAFACGFQSLANFSRTFKACYGIAPRMWDRQSALKISKIRQIDGETPFYNEDELHQMAHNKEFQVTLQDFPARPVAYRRVIDSYSNDHVLKGFDHVLMWARQTGIHGRLIGMSQDDPDVTPMRYCRYDVCIETSVLSHGLLQHKTLPACRIAVLDVCGDLHAVDRAWQYLFRWWLPRSRYAPANLPAMEVYHRGPHEIGWDLFDLACCVPLVRL
jgi:AraC family transcriptional regulator